MFWGQLKQTASLFERDHAVQWRRDRECALALSKIYCRQYFILPCFSSSNIQELFFAHSIRYSCSGSHCRETQLVFGARMTFKESSFCYLINFFSVVTFKMFSKQIKQSTELYENTQTVNSQQLRS